MNPHLEAVLPLRSNGTVWQQQLNLFTVRQWHTTT